MTSRSTSSAGVSTCASACVVAVEREPSEAGTMGGMVWTTVSITQRPFTGTIPGVRKQGRVGEPEQGPWRQGRARWLGGKIGSSPPYTSFRSCQCCPICPTGFGISPRVDFATCGTSVPTPCWPIRALSPVRPRGRGDQAPHTEHEDGQIHERLERGPCPVHPIAQPAEALEPAERAFNDVAL